MSDEEPRNRSGGGIVFGGGERAARRPAGNLAELTQGLRRRWVSGVAVVTAVDPDGSLRGVTVTALMVVSADPPMLAIAFSTAGSFHERATTAARLGVNVLETAHGFPAERFAGRAPVPDGRFSGVPHAFEAGAPVLDGALGWCVGKVTMRINSGDHVLVLLDIVAGALGDDTDDPLVSYEGRYRRLESG